MRIGRVLFASVGALVVAVLLGTAIVSYWNRESQFDPTKLIIAVDAYVRTEKSMGRAMPAEITLKQLIEAGYITPEHVREFEGMDVTIALNSGKGPAPGPVVRARRPDGSVMVVMADGMVQELPATNSSTAK